MIAYKGFNKDLTCRGHQFKETEVNITDNANVTQNGFHCAENPLDCLDYYPNWNESVYYKVIADGDLNEDGCDSKISCTRLSILEKLDINRFIDMSLEYMVKHPLRKCNSRVKEEYAEAEEGFIIVRGKYPVVKGKIGVTIGMAQECAISSRIIRIKRFTIDGTRYLPDVWYDILGCPADFEREVIK
jgi:hypothetical protein